MNFYAKNLIFLLGLLSGAPLAYADCETNFGYTVKSALESFREKYEFFRAINSKDNIAFRALARRANQDETTEAKLFVDLENAVMKDLNDEYVKNHDVVTALVNFHKSVFWRELMADPVLKAALVGKYSDPKSMRFAFSSDSPEIIERLQAVYAKAGESYERQILALPDSRRWFKNTRGLAQSAYNWHLGGHGPTPDLAGVTVRDARDVAQTGERAALHSFNAAEQNLIQKAALSDALRARIETRWASVARVMSRSKNGKLVLSFEAINVIRKAPPKGASLNASIGAIQEDFFARFKVIPTRQEVIDFRAYMAASDAFSPGIYIDKRVEIELGKAKHGIFSVDFTAQNARNIEGTMMALADTEGASLHERLPAVRASEAKVTAALDHDRRSVAVVGEGKGGVADFTGDDGAYFPDHELTQAEKRTIIRRLTNRIGVDRGRVVFLPSKFVDSGAEIPAALRSEWIGAAESAEKKLSKALINKFGPKANDLTLVMDLQPRSDAKVVGVYIALPNGQQPSAVLLAETRRILTELGWKVQKIQVP